MLKKLIIGEKEWGKGDKSNDRGKGSARGKNNRSASLSKDENKSDGGAKCVQANHNQTENSDEPPRPSETLNREICFKPGKIISENLILKKRLIKEKVDQKSQ